MARNLIFLVPLLLIALPSSMQAFPSDTEIAVLARRFCELPSQSEQDYEEVFMQEFYKWLNSGSVTPREIDSGTKSQALGEIVGEQLTTYMMQMCPNKVEELESLGIFGS
jgi:hypothetical protein